VIIAEDTELTAQRRAGKSEAAFRTISEVSEDLDVPQHVLRFWESKFPQIKPLKRGGGRRYYRPEDVSLLRRIRDLLYKDGYTIKGVQKLLREQGKPASDDIAANASPQPATPRASRSKIDPLPAIEAEEEIVISEPDLPVQHRLFDLDADLSDEIHEDPGALPAIDSLSPNEDFDLAPKVWIQPAPPPPLSATSPHFRPGDRAELLNILTELEDLRELLSISRRGN